LTDFNIFISQLQSELVSAYIMKKRSERRKHCAPKFFAPPQTPFPGRRTAKI